MQAGSTFKVFTLLAALSKDDPISTRDPFNGHSPQFFEEFEDPGASTDEARRGRVTNFGFESFGTIDLRTATANSVNTVYARLNIEAGPRTPRPPRSPPGCRTRAWAPTRQRPRHRHRHGSSTWPTPTRPSPSGACGSALPHPQRQGRPGRHRLQGQGVKKAAFDKDVVADTVDAMTQVVERGSGSYAQRLGRPLAGKTGTSTSNKAAWFDGFAPQLATAVGIYKGDGTKSMSNIDGLEVTGGSIPVRIWTDFMETALKGQKVVDFPERAGVGDDDVATPTSTATVVEHDHLVLDDDHLAVDDHVEADGAADHHQDHQGAGPPPPPTTITVLPNGKPTTTQDP